MLLHRIVLVSGLLSQLAFGSETEDAFRKVKYSKQVRIQAAYSSEAAQITDPTLVRELAEEISQLQRKQWVKETVIKHGGCMYQVSFLGDRQVFLHLYVYSEQVHRRIDQDAKSKQARAALHPDELPKLKARLAQLKHEARCKNAA